MGHVYVFVSPNPERLGIVGIVSEKTKMKRGQKLCTNCDCINGVRAYECKECGSPFKMKKARRGPRKKLVENFKELNRGDTIRVVGGSGCYYIDKQGDKHYFTDRGKYIVQNTDDKGIQAVGSHGYTYIYMGKKRRSKLLDNMFNAPHKVLLLRDVSQPNHVAAKPRKRRS